MINYWVSLIFLLFFCSPILAQEEIFFGSPIEGELRLSGTFGELRSNHFHAGIDIKGGMGRPLLAIADGYISRIKVLESSYGQVVYINHPNGYTSVYAHMNRFTPEVEKYVRSVQYKNKSYEIDHELSPNQFPVKKGQKVGEMGTTGYSFGPHLHFEIRETATSIPINPLAVGIKAVDNIPPFIKQLKVYELDDKGASWKDKTINTIGGKTTDRIYKDTIYTNSDQVGLAIKSFDLLNNAKNWNGVYSIDMYVNDSLYWQFAVDAIPFEETRYINAHVDYKETLTTKGSFNRCFLLPGNRLSNYKAKVNNGIITVNKEAAALVEFVVKDIKGNQHKLKTWVKQKTSPQLPPDRLFNYLLPHDQANIIERNNIKINIDEGILYDDLYLQLGEEFDNSDDIFSNVFQIQDYYTPVHQYYNIGIKPHHLPDDLRDKAFIAYCTPQNKTINCGGEWRGDFLHAEVRDLGAFYVAIDTIPPTIKPKKWSTNMKGWSKIGFEIKDNMKGAPNIKHLTYEAKIDGEWVLCQFDKKNDYLFHYFSKDLATGSHHFLLKITDTQGNTTLFEHKFIY